MQFEIIKVFTEKRIDGRTLIQAKSIEENPICIEVQIDTCNLSDREFIKNGLEKIYNELIIVNDVESIKVGDIL